MAEWQNGFCNFCSSPTDCIFGYCCPCIYAAVASDEAGQGLAVAALQCLCYPLLIPFLRKDVRDDKGIPGSLLKDILLGWCLPCCTMIQARTELN